MSPSLLAAEAAGRSAEAEGGGGFMIGLAIAFMVVAVGLFFLEILIPSFGLITLIGLVCVAASLMAAFSVSRLVGVAFVAVVVVSMPLLVYLAVKVVKRTSLMLGPEDTPGAGGDAASAVSEDAAGLATGARGVALTVLRPSGSASFNGRKVSVVTQGEMVEAGAQIEVVRLEGMRTVVRPIRV